MHPLARQLLAGTGSAAALTIPATTTAAAIAEPAPAIGTTTVSVQPDGKIDFTLQASAHCKLRFYIDKPHRMNIVTGMSHGCGLWQMRGVGYMDGCTNDGGLGCIRHINVGPWRSRGKSSVCIVPRHMHHWGAGFWIKYGVEIRKNRHAGLEYRGMRYLHHIYWIRWGLGHGWCHTH